MNIMAKSLFASTGLIFAASMSAQAQFKATFDNREEVGEPRYQFGLLRFMTCDKEYLPIPDGTTLVYDSAIKCDISNADTEAADSSTIAKRVLPTPLCPDDPSWPHPHANQIDSEFLQNLQGDLDRDWQQMLKGQGFIEVMESDTTLNPMIVVPETTGTTNVTVFLAQDVAMSPDAFANLNCTQPTGGRGPSVEQRQKWIDIFDDYIDDNPNWQVDYWSTQSAGMQNLYDRIEPELPDDYKPFAKQFADKGLRQYMTFTTFAEASQNQ